MDILFRLNGFGIQQDKLAFPLNPDTVIYDKGALGHTDLQIRSVCHLYGVESEGVKLILVARHYRIIRHSHLRTHNDN